MKKLLLILPFLLFVKFGNAQTFAPAGSYWRYCSVTWPFWTSHASYFEIGSRDTIDGKEIITLSGSASNLFYDSPYRFHVSGDSTFVFDESDSSLTLLFNFSFQLGDTLRLTEKNSLRMYGNNNEDDFARFVVDSLGMVTIQGNNYRFYEMKYDTSSTDFGFQTELEMTRLRVVEQIGLVNNFIIPVFYGGTWDGARPDLFYYTNNQTPDFEGDSAGVCVLSMDENTIWAGQIYPNPVSDIVTIQSPYSQDVYASISDLYGRNIKDGIRLTANSSTTISMEEFSAGVYIISITEDIGQVISRKIIKQ